MRQRTSGNRLQLCGWFLIAIGLLVLAFGALLIVSFWGLEQGWPGERGLAIDVATLLGAAALPTAAGRCVLWIARGRSGSGTARLVVTKGSGGGFSQ